MALNTVLPPIAAAARYKPTIIVGQEDTVLFEETDDNIEARLSAVFDGYRERNLPTVPKLVCLGSRCDRLTGRFFVCYPPLRYAVTSARRAIDILIKLTAVFALPHSKISKLVWHFIASAVYNIPLEEQYDRVNKIVQFYRSS